MINRTKAIVMAVMAVVAATTVAFVVFAQADTDSATSPREGLLAKVAANLGVSVDDLLTAFSKARLEMIDEAVAAGRITAEQAQLMKDRIEARQALREVFAEAMADGKITPDQLALLRGRMGGRTDVRGAMPAGRGVAGRMLGRVMERKCSCR